MIKIIHSFIRFISNSYLSKITLILFIGLFILGLKPAVKMISSIDTGLKSLLPKTHPSVDIGDEVSKKFFNSNSGGDLIVIVSSEESNKAQRAFLALVDYLKKSPLIERVKYKKTRDEFRENHELLYLEIDEIKEIQSKINREIEKKKLGDLYIDFESDEGDEKNDQGILYKFRDRYQTGLAKDFYTNPDENDFALWIYPKSKDGSLKYYQHFFKEMQSYIKDFKVKDRFEGVELFYAGSIKTRIDEYTNLMSDLKKAGVVSLVGIFLVLLFYLRSISGVVCLLIPLVASIVFTFWGVSFFIQKLNIITSFLFSILLGLGVDVGIHLFSRFIEERRKLPRVEALTHMLTHTGRSAVVGILTTMVIFIILIFNDFKGFSEFGLIASMGLGFTLFTFIVFFPAILTVLDSIPFFHRSMMKASIRSHSKTNFDGIKPRKGMIAFGILFLVSAFLMTKVNFEWDYGALRMKVPQTVIAKEKLKSISSRVNRPAAIMIDGKEDVDQLKARFNELKNKDPQNTSLYRFISSYDLVPENQDEKMELLNEIDLSLQDEVISEVENDLSEMIADFQSSIRRTKKVTPDLVTDAMKDKFFGNPPYEEDEVAYIYPKSDLELDDGRNAILFFKEAFKTTINDKVFYATSNSMIFADVLLTMFSDIEKIILASILALLIIVYFDFRSIKKSLLVLSTLVFGMVVMIGLVSILGWKFSFFNMIILPVVLGMGVDNSIHLIHRFDETSSISEALKTTGRASFLATLTTMIGYSGLLFAHHPGLKSIGNFAIVGMLCCMLGSLVFLPLILLKMKKSD
jgi:hypothetical protein